MEREFTVGIGGAAGDGLDKSGDTLAKGVSRMGLYVYAYNSYQSIIRGGHIWLRVRIGEKKVHSHGDHLNLLIALNQDTVERHAREVEPGGAVLYNSDRFTCETSLLRDSVVGLPLPVNEITKPFGRLLPIMQNTVALGAVMFLARFDFDSTAGVLGDTFKHKGQAVVDQNVKIMKAGYDYAQEHFVPLVKDAWNFSRVRRPFATGNELFALGAATAGCKFYSAYPMTPASSILHWMASHGEKCGVVVEIHHHEVGTAGQAEIDMKYSTLTKMADQVLLYKYVIKNVGRRRGKTVTVMPKPLFQDNGSGMHTHQSLWKKGKNIFYDKKGYALLSDTARHYIGGLLRHAHALCGLIAPTTNSYRRLVPGYEAPINLAYSQRNRSACIRIPTYSTSEKARRLEFRTPDPSCNPYLAFPAMLMAGLDGVKNKIEPPAPVEKDLYELSGAEAKKIKSMPGSLDQALDALEADHDFLLEGGVFTPDVIETWIAYKRKKEVDAIRLRPHPYEFSLYFDI